MLYRARYIDYRDNEGKFCTELEQRNPKYKRNTPKVRTTGIRHTLTFKLITYYILIILIHVYLGFIIPQFQIMPMLNNYWLALYYLLWCLYFYYSGL